jgi:hypothetical protein
MIEPRLRPYQTGDAFLMRDCLIDAGAALDKLYPGSSAWLERKLLDAETGEAVWTIVEVGDLIVGFAIETRKGIRRRKLSTVWLEPFVRGLGYGHAVVRARRKDWLTQDLDEVYATGRLRVIEPVGRLLIPVGFQFSTIHANRYGPEQHEAVLIWNRHSAKSSQRVGWVSRELHRLRTECEYWLQNQV